MPILRSPILVGVAALAVACGASLEPQVRSALGYTSPTRCAQGPYEFHAKALGWKWGEAIELRQVKGRPVVGHAEVWIDGKKQLDWGVTLPQAAYGAPPTSSTLDNAACLLSAAERATPSAGSATPTPAPASPSEPLASAPTVPVVPTAPPSALVDVAIGGAPPSGNALVQWAIQVDRWSSAALVPKAGVEIRVVFWSSVLLDLQDVEFVLVQSAYVPSNGDEKWAAKLDAEKAEAGRVARDENAELKRCRDLATKSTVDDKCKQRGWHNVAETERCADLAAKDAVDEPCRRLNYENATEARERTRCQALQDANSVDEVCRSKGYRNRSESAAHDADVPKTAPPAPQSEERPPQPSTHAEWVPGNWEWSAGAWVWVGGGWHVPDSDRAAKATPTAPSAPPAAQAEAPPAPPAGGLVWLAGYWHWTAGRWVWVQGRWARPPQRGATWRPHVWVTHGAGVRLDPGQWVLPR